MSDIALRRDQYLELEKLAQGAFTPLAGFMDEDAFAAVVGDMRLPDGAPFPLPVVLDVDAATAARVRGLPRVALTYDGVEVGTVAPESVFAPDKGAAARAVFGTADTAHPGVAFWLDGGSHCIGGPVDLTTPVAAGRTTAELTPAQSKAAFAAHGWRTVAGFQTRNVPHRAHEYLHRVVLEVVDGLFVHPLVGRRKAGDYTPEAIAAAYEALIGSFYPRDRVVLSMLSTAMRYAGPREAVFHAIIRRNYGCSHFVVGRDHAGVGDYYGLYDAHELCARFAGELGIDILALSGPFHCRKCGGIVSERTCPHLQDAPQYVTQVSGTAMREILAGDRTPDPELMRPEVIAAVTGRPLFVGGDGSEGGR